MASKIKKALKKIGKAAAVAGAGYLAMKGLKGKGTAFSRPKRGTIDQMAADAKMPSNLTKNMGMKGRDSILGKPGINRLGDMDDNMYAAKGGRATKTKPKSIGKALRGGGKVMR
jgi:hypothetical protein